MQSLFCFRAITIRAKYLVYRFPVDRPRNWVQSQKLTGRFLLRERTLDDVRLANLVGNARIVESRSCIYGGLSGGWHGTVRREGELRLQDDYIRFGMTKRLANIPQSA